MALWRTAQMKLSPIKEIELKASRIPGVVSLAQGIPSFDTPEPIKAFVQQKIAEGACARYSLTPGLPQLRELIGETLLREGMHYDPEDEILVTCGSIEAIAAAVLTVIQPGDEVILPAPSYTSYQEVIRMAGGTPCFVPLREEDNFDFDPEALERCISPRTAAILYSNPNNPTGTVFSRAETLRIVQLAGRYGLFVIIDEAYKDFIYTKEPYFTPAQIPEMRRRVIRTFTFSKAYGMTGWRVGFLHSDKENVREILKVHDALVTCAPVASQYAAMAALELGEEYTRAFREEFKRRRDRVIEHLDRLSHVFDYQKPSGSYFVFPRVKDTIPWARDSRRLAYDILEQARVALVPGVAFGPTGEAHLRINFGREVAEIDVAFERLEGYFNQSASSACREVSAYSGTGRPTKQLLRWVAVAYLSVLSRLFLWRKRPRVVAIVGSRGKTVMKRLLGELFAEHYRVRTNPRSCNTEIGLPLAVLDLEIDTRSTGRILLALVQATWRALFSREWVEVLVLEFGVRQRGDMHQLLKAVRPDVAILTNLMPQYTSDFAFLQTLQEEVRVLCREVGQRCQFIVDGDDPLLQEAVSGLPAAPVTLHRDQVRQHDHGLLFQSNGRPYHITREVVGESERVSIQVAVLLAERWEGFSREGVERFLAGAQSSSLKRASPGEGKP